MKKRGLTVPLQQKTTTASYQPIFISRCPCHTTGDYLIENVMLGFTVNSDEITIILLSSHDLNGFAITYHNM